MGLIEDELSEIRKLCEHLVRGSRLVSCVQTMVRAEIKSTDYKKIVVCIQFPIDYPTSTVLIELKSKTLSDKFLKKLTEICDIELKKLIGKPQILKILLFIRNFLDENPLCCCYEEIINIKKLLSTVDELKLKQKSSSLVFKVFQDEYFFKCKIIILDDYPNSCIRIEDTKTNFSLLLNRHIVGQSQEIARRCVEPPLCKKKSNESNFKPEPSLEKVAKFIIDCIKNLPMEKCQVCKNDCLPRNPEDVEKNEQAAKHIERVYCGHLYHLECLMSYMKKPPFQNKKCANPDCDKSIYHVKWGLSDKLAENRWSHEQARERELAEVTDFFK